MTTKRPAMIGRATIGRLTSVPARLRRRRGNGVLEAALVLPVLLYLSMGMVEFGQFLYVKHTFQAASRDAARTAILGSATHQQARDAATNALVAAGFADATKYTITFYNAGGSPPPNPLPEITNIQAVAKGTSIRVTVTGTAGNVSVRPLGIIPASKAVLGSTTMIKE